MPRREVTEEMERLSQVCSWTMRMNQSRRRKREIRTSEVPRLMKMFKSRSAIWETDAGLTTTSRQKFRQGNTDPQRLSLEQTTTLQLMCGVLLAPSSKW
jgi:hypothetical protein